MKHKSTLIWEYNHCTCISKCTCFAINGLTISGKTFFINIEKEKNWIYLLYAVFQNNLACTLFKDYNSEVESKKLIIDNSTFLC